MGIFERSNSNSFDLNSNGLNRKWVIGGPKMFGYLVELRKIEKRYIAKIEAKSCDN